VRRVSTHHSTRDLGERCKLPQRSLGRSLGRKWILYIFQVTKKAIWNTLFSIFERWRGPQTSRGPGRLFTLSPSRRACQKGRSSESGVLGRAMPLPAARPFHKLGGLGSAVRKLAFPVGSGAEPRKLLIFTYFWTSENAATH